MTEFNVVYIFNVDRTFSTQLYKSRETYKMAKWRIPSKKYEPNGKRCLDESGRNRLMSKGLIRKSFEDGIDLLIKPWQ